MQPDDAQRAKSAIAAALLALALAFVLAATSQSQGASRCAANCTAAAVLRHGPDPLLPNGRAVKWWFVFKLNAAVFPGCVDSTAATCPFGGTPRSYQRGQQYVYASSADTSLKKGSGCAGETTSDPIGATFNKIYNGSYHYVVWNDQFKGDPAIDYTHCTGSGQKQECGAPWAHSKGMVAWDDAGNGLVMQVTTPSWPASGSARHPRKLDGNTLGCIIDDNVEYSQHFFALKLTPNDLIKVLEAMQNASVVTDPSNPQIVNNGGPAGVTKLVSALGALSTDATPTVDRLSAGVTLISKPPDAAVAPWQMVSAVLGGASLRVASWWGEPNEIPSTTSSTRITCWDRSLGKAGPVQIATSGVWSGKSFGLKEGVLGKPPDANHAKIGVSTDSHRYAILGDMNQQGSLLESQGCTRSQNGRGGMFFVINDARFYSGVHGLIAGSSAPTTVPK